MIDQRVRDFLSRVRQNPFLRVSEQAIRERAFFASEKAVQVPPEEHWLDAEATETDVQATQQLVRLYDREEPALATLMFDNAYTPLRSWYFPTDAEGHKVALGMRTPRQCSICRGTSGSAEPALFRKVAHLVPEALGNRWLTTFDECDGCNERFGQQYEDDLGKMTLAVRAMTGTRTKVGTARLKPKKRSSVGGGARGAAVRLDLYVDDPSVVSRLEDDDHLVVETDMQPFRPGRAAKALARVAWQCLPTERRLAHEPLRAWLAGGVLGATTLYSAWVPEHHGLAVGLWETKDPKLPSLVLAVGLASTVLVWSAPDWSTGRYDPTLFPLLPRSSRGVLPTVSRFSAPGDERVRGRATFQLGFERAVLVQARDPIEVIVEAQTPDGMVTVHSCLHVQQMPPDLELKGAAYEIRDGELVGLVQIAVPFAGEVAGRYVFDALSSLSADVQKTSAFVKALNHGLGFRVIEKAAGRTIATIGGSRGPLDDDEIPARVRIGDWLAEINRTLALRIAYPQSVDKREGWTLEIIAEGIRKGSVAERPQSGSVEFIAGKAAMRDLVALVSQAPPAIEAMNTIDYEFKGTRIDAGPVRLVVEAPRLQGDAAEHLRRIDSWAEDTQEPVSILCDRVIYQFLSFLSEDEG